MNAIISLLIPTKDVEEGFAVQQVEIGPDSEKKIGFGCDQSGLHIITQEAGTTLTVHLHCAFHFSPYCHLLHPQPQLDPQNCAHGQWSSVR